MGEEKDFRGEVLKGFWHDLKDQLERGALIVVNPALDLEAVANDVTNDDAARIQDLISKQQIGKPSLEQITAWDQAATKEFHFVIVQPYVLIQEIGLN